MRRSLIAVLVAAPLSVVPAGVSHAQAGVDVFTVSSPNLVSSGQLWGGGLFFGKGSGLRLSGALGTQSATTTQLQSARTFAFTTDADFVVGPISILGFRPYGFLGVGMMARGGEGMIPERGPSGSYGLGILARIVGPLSLDLSSRYRVPFDTTHWNGNAPRGRELRAGLALHFGGGSHRRQTVSPPIYDPTPVYQPVPIYQPVPVYSPRPEPQTPWPQERRPEDKPQAPWPGTQRPADPQQPAGPIMGHQPGVDTTVHTTPANNPSPWPGAHPPANNPNAGSPAGTPPVTTPPSTAPSKRSPWSWLRSHGDDKKGQQPKGSDKKPDVKKPDDKKPDDKKGDDKKPEQKQPEKPKPHWPGSKP